MILLDYSQVALSNVFQFKDQLKKGSDHIEAANIIRHAVLTGVKGMRKKFGRTYGEMVIACDGKQYWRKDIFPHYKAGRKAARDKQDLDWTLIFDTISLIREEIAEHFPYRVIHIDKAEADDIIGTLAGWTQTNGLIENALFADKQPVMIVSSDGDFKQLHKYDNVKQYNPILKKDVTVDDPAAYLRAHIAKAGDDGIPNVLSPDDVFITEGVRQTPMRQARLDLFIEKGRDACEDPEQTKRWDRNNALINLDLIPESIKGAIISAYIVGTPKGNKMAIYNYLVKNRCRLLLNEVEEF